MSTGIDDISDDYVSDWDCNKPTLIISDDKYKIYVIRVDEYTRSSRVIKVS